MLLVLALSVGFPRMAPADEETDAKKEALLKAIQLPQVAELARKAGINPEDIKDLLKTAQKDKVPAKEMEEVLDASVKTTDEHGPIDNFGAFVQSKLKEGLRGRDLANAIRQEHATRGKGKGHAHGRPNNMKEDREDKPDKSNKEDKAKDKADKSKKEKNKEEK